MRIANKDARKHVEKLNVFTGSNTSGSWEKVAGKSVYVVRSYAAVIFLYDAQNIKWYENPRKYSRTTSKHTNQLRPSGVFLYDLRTFYPDETQPQSVTPRQTVVLDSLYA